MNSHSSTNSVLGQLRNLSPRRSLSPGEAIRVAEQQALRLLALSARKPSSAAPSGWRRLATATPGR